HRAFGTGYPVLLGASEAAISVEPYRLRIHHQLAEAAPDRSVVRQATRADQLRELAERQLDPQRRRDAKPRALEHQRSQRDVPAIAGAADDIVVGDECAIEEDLVELRVTRDLAQRTHRHAGLAHVQDEVREIAVARLIAGPGEQHAPVGAVRIRGPNLLTTDAPAAIDPFAARAHRREVTARVGLAEALAPDLVAREDRVQQAALLLIGAVGDDHGP